MPSLETARRIAGAKYNGAKTISQMHKENSDFIMENTWDSDIQSRVCYIYDYLHDDQPDRANHMTYENTTKIKIDAKFIISSYGSIDKDQVAYHLMFKPSQPVEFNEDNDLYWFETDYRKRFDVKFPLSLYVDIPDEKGVYTKWMICDWEEGNQFIKYVILPCDYRLQWISVEGDKRVKRQMWCCTRAMNSYTSGLWIDRYINNLDEVTRLLLPLNNITQSFGHLNGEDNQRVIISAKTSKPLVWRVSKVENAKPIGVIRISLKQDQYDQHKDYIEYDSDGYITGMWADYFVTETTPVEPEEPIHNLSCQISASNDSIKIGGSYKLLTTKIVDEDGNDITDQYSESNFKWNCFIDNVDYTQSELVTWLEQSSFNKIKIKFGNDRSYLDKILTVKCAVEDIPVGEIQLNLII